MASRKTSRRNFIKLAATSAVAAGAAPVVLGSSREERLAPRRHRPVPPSDTIQVATIGMGIMGFGDTRTALRVPGVELVAVADCYDGRLARTREVFGKEVFTTRDYKEILARPEVDAVIIATPDHWHAQMAIDAMRAGKHVYLEKPMVQDVEEGPQVIQVEEETGRILIVGSQRVSSVIYEKAKELYESGALGRLNMVEAYMNRNSAIGAWQYAIAPDASPETIAWEQFLGPAPSRPFDPVRFFRWRNYWDYGTGVPGDLFVHLFSGIHYVLGSNGPTSVVSSGGLRVWKDGRDVPDVMTGIFEYPETPSHPDFTLSLKVNFANGGGGGEAFRFIGDEGMLEIGYNGVTLSQLPPRRTTLQEFTGYNSVYTFTEEMQREAVEQFRAEHPDADAQRIESSTDTVYRAPGGYDDRFDHFTNFFEAIRNGTSVVEDGRFGYRAAAPAVLSNLSYRENRVIRWDPEAMRLVS